VATSPAQLDAIVARVEPLPITAKRMFGEYALYLDNRIPAFVIDGVLSVKVTSLEDERLTVDLLGPIFPGSKDYWRIPEPLAADGDWLRELLMATAALIDPPKPKAAKRSKAPGASRT